MRILHLMDMKGQLGDAIRISKIYHKLRACGAEVIVVNFRSYHRPRVQMLKRPVLWAQFLFDSLRHYDRTRFYPQTALYQLVTEKKIRECKPDAVWCEGFLLPGVIADLCEKHGIPMITDVHGFGSTEYSEDRFENPVEERYEHFRALEQQAIDKSRFLITVSKPMSAHLIHRGARLEQLVCIPNGADPQSTTATYQDPFKVIYGGIFEFWEDVDSYLNAAKRSRRHRFYLAGGGKLKDHVEGRIKNEDIRVKYLGRIPRDRVIQLFANMQVGIAPSSDGVTRRVACPIKVFDYLACGLPVVTPDIGEWAAVIREKKCGVVTELSAGDHFETALEQLSDRRTWEEMSSNAVALIKNEWNWDRLLEPIDDVLARL